MTDAESEARDQHPSSQTPEKKAVRDLKKLNDSMESVFAAVEAEVAKEEGDFDFPADQPFAVIHLLMTRDGVHRLVEVLQDGRSQKAFKFLIHLGNMIVHQLIDQSLYIAGDDDDH